MRDMFLETLSIYETASQSMWRALELNILRKLRRTIVFEGPTLEIGCGDWAFSSLIFDTIDEGSDVKYSSVDRLRKESHVHKRLWRMDARSMEFAHDSYRTVFANCVIEHIPDLAKVLSDSYRMLIGGGRFIASVPLKEMNHHLLLKGTWYAELRRRQLQHVNLLTEDEWKQMFCRAGFQHVETFPYLFAKGCRLWDMMDLIVCIGIKNYTVSGVLRKIGAMVPGATKKVIYRPMAKWLSGQMNEEAKDDPCAIVIVAQK